MPSEIGVTVPFTFRKRQGVLPAHSAARLLTRYCTHCSKNTGVLAGKVAGAETVEHNVNVVPAIPVTVCDTTPPIEIVPPTARPAVIIALTAAAEASVTWPNGPVTPGLSVQNGATVAVIGTTSETLSGPVSAPTGFWSPGTMAVLHPGRGVVIP